MKTNQDAAERKSIIARLNDIQEEYIDPSTSELDLNERGKQFLFDFVVNCKPEEGDFGDYLEQHGEKIENLLNAY